MSLQHLQTPAYSNWTMISPSGEIMCRCAMKRAKWYLDRGLAEMISENPPTIKLNFEPNGHGNKDDAYSLASKQNCCVVCGTENDLTKHHIVPSMYRKFFPVKLKARSSHDVVVICIQCHEEYETEATKLKKKIALEFGEPNLEKMSSEVKMNRIICGLCNALLNKNSIPVERQFDIMMSIVEFLGKTPTFEDLENLANVKFINESPQAGKFTIDQIDNLEPFIKRWRQHFLDVAKPEFMPDHWSVDRDV